MNTNINLDRFTVAEGRGSVTDAPNLPAGFTDTFSSRYIDANGVRLHAVIGGAGPAVLFVHGWPQNWYAWRHLMPELARNYTVIAVDQRGVGLSDKPAAGYDTGTVAADLIALIDALGIQQVAVVGHDTGFAVSYALGADYPDRVVRLALAEIPGAPGTTPPPPLFVPSQVNAKLWHIPFNRAEGLPEQLIAGREDAYFGYEFAIQGGGVPQETMDYYIGLVSDPASLTGSLGFYRSFDETVAQNQQRATRKLQVPVLAIGGERSYAEHVAEATSVVAEHVEGVVIKGAGHWVAEEAPDQLLDALTAFLSPLRHGEASDAVLAASVR